MSHGNRLKLLSTIKLGVLNHKLLYTVRATNILLQHNMKTSAHDGADLQLF